MGPQNGKQKWGIWIWKTIVIPVLFPGCVYLGFTVTVIFVLFFKKPKPPSKPVNPPTTSHTVERLLENSSETPSDSASTSTALLNEGASRANRIENLVSKWQKWKKKTEMIREKEALILYSHSVSESLEKKFTEMMSRGAPRAYIESHPEYPRLLAEHDFREEQLERLEELQVDIASLENKYPKLKTFSPHGRNILINSSSSRFPGPSDSGNPRISEGDE